MGMSSLCNFISVSLALVFSLCFISVFGVATGVEHSEETDRLALLDIKYKIHGSGHEYKGLLELWNDSVHHCNWKGVTCGHRHRRVTVLDLSSQGLFGSLSPAIGNLTFLQALSIEENDFHDQIPPQIGFLSRLRILLATNNSLEGEIPVNMSRCHNLEQLRLTRNKLHGNIPHQFSSLTGLRKLGLDKNRLTGTIDVLGNLTSLEVLSISKNGFHGQIPSIIGRLKGLTMLVIGANSFVGQLPPSIYNLSLLNTLSFGDSLIHGSLPQNLGLTLPRLQRLQVLQSQIEGPIPISLSNLSDIKSIELAESRFSGRIRLNGRNLPKLASLDLGDNLFLGSRGAGDLDFLNSLVNCSHLLRLHLAGNQLGGVLPSSVANLSKNLELLELGNNLISGSIPPGLGQLGNLQDLLLYRNRFTGRIPDDIGMLKMLSKIYLEENYFSVSIPASLGNLSQLIELNLGNNQLRGAIPSSLGKLTKLQTLNLERNKLTGEIPPYLFHASSLSQGLYLGGNQLWGTLPVEIGQLQHLALLNISNNKLSGDIPQNLSQCSSLTELYMGGNSFSGSIRGSLSSLKGLLSLDLSRNNLSGQIPSYLSHFSLVSLNLSFNNLEGEVPMKGIFTNATEVSLVGNKRLCGGITQLHLPTCHGSSQSKEKKKTLLVIFLVSILSLLVGVIVPLLLILFLRRSRRKNESSASPPEDSSSVVRVSYNMLLKATEGFSSRNFIGMGSFGSVYNAVLNIDGKSTAVAAKVLKLQHRGSAESFIRECEALRNIRHRNLVSIISACSSIDFQGNDFKALVYELMPKGNLDQWLHLNPKLDNGQVNENQSSGPQYLNLLQRISIAIDVACALDYLHHECGNPIVHCDLKPSNILLDNDMVAHVGDFGLARLLPKEIISQSLSSAAGVQGTVGYAPPEYGLGNKISTRGDVYSYGIVLLEMMTAKKPTDQMFQNTLSLHDYARIVASDNVMEILDPKLLEVDETIADVQRYREGGYARKLESLVSMIKVGVECSVESPQDRMNIKDVVRVLKARRELVMGTRSV